MGGLLTPGAGAGVNIGIGSGGAETGAGAGGVRTPLSPSQRRASSLLIGGQLSPTQSAAMQQLAAEAQAYARV
jgi:hypothetical protein